MTSKVYNLVALLILYQSLNSLLTHSTDPNDAIVMKQLAFSLSGTPFSWNNSNHYCNWSGISCDASFRVSAIYLSDLSLSGTLPTDLDSLTHLTSLNLDHNHLSGPLPSFANLHLLEDIRLDANNFTSMPNHAFSGLTNLKILTLSDNLQLSSWTIPTQLANSPSLTYLFASNANLVGSIPDLFSSFPRLQQVDLSDNHLNGLLPLSLMSLPNLAYIFINNNKLQGPLPVFSGNANVTLGASGNSFCKNKPGPCDQQVMTLLHVVEAIGYPIELADAWKGNNACEQWRFVRCDSHANVISIDFAGQGFQGSISPAFGNLTSLVELHLNDNNLTGTIPESLTRLIHLTTLDISNNNLSSPLPQFRPNVNVNISGNSHMVKIPVAKAPPVLLSVSKAKTSRRKTLIWIKVLILVGGFITLIFVICIVVKLYKKKKHIIRKQKETQQLENSLHLLPNNPIRFSYEVLKVATNNFEKQHKLGSGGFGSVFYGTLTDGTRVAVKKLEHFSQGKKEFVAEVRTMGSTQHLNLVKLVGFCAEETYTLLVYEYMSNGSLDKWIFYNHNSSISLNWDIRKRIIWHISKGLAYLHEDCLNRIVHLDIKPQNVLLDEGFNAKLSDFGLAKLIDRDQSHVMTQMRGTRGYLAPEWLDRKITEKADVYSYGVLVLEVVFERKNLDSYPTEESDNRLIHIVRKKVEANQLSDLLNKCSEDMQQNGQDVEKTIKLALWCLHMNPKKRPSMSMVVKILEGVLSMDFIKDHDLLSSPIDDENATSDYIIQVSDCVLSGPR